MEIEKLEQIIGENLKLSNDDDINILKIQSAPFVNQNTVENYDIISMISQLETPTNKNKNIVNDQQLANKSLFNSSNLINNPNWNNNYNNKNKEKYYSKFINLNTQNTLTMNSNNQSKINNNLNHLNLKKTPVEKSDNFILSNARNKKYEENEELLNFMCNKQHNYLNLDNNKEISLCNPVAQIPIKPNNSLHKQTNFDFLQKVDDCQINDQINLKEYETDESYVIIKTYLKFLYL